METCRRLGVVVIVLLFLASCAPAAPTAAPTKAPAAPPPTAAPTAPAVAAPTAAPKAEPAATPKPAAPTATPAPKIKRGGTLIRGDYVDVSSWDPAFSTNSVPMAETVALEAPVRWELVDEKTAKHEAKPWLAESWQVVDPKTITLKLRQGVKFHDGSDFNAEAAKWQLERTRTHPKSLGKSFLAAIDSIDIVDAYTIRLNLKAPSATIFVNLTNSAAGSGSTGTLMISKAAFDKLGEEAMALKPVGTGPFTMDEWRRDDRTIYNRWDQYWKQGEDGKRLPYVDRVEVRVVRDVNVGVIELKGGTLHVFKDIAAKDVPGVKTHAELNFIAMSWAAKRHTQGFNPAKSPFGTNLKLRQAAQHALDRDTVAQTLGAGYYTPDYYNGWIPAFPGWDEKNPRYEFNLDKAKQLMKDAGFADGVTVAFTTVSEFEPKRIAEVAQAMWAKVGIKATVDAFEGAAFKEMGLAGKLELMQIGYTGSPDPDGFARAFTCKGGANFADSCNPELDKCMAEGRTIYDFAQRHEVYKRCQRILYEDAMFYGVIMEPPNIVYRKEVKNLKINQHLVDLREAWLDK